jgi:hypothetical protein
MPRYITSDVNVSPAGVSGTVSPKPTVVSVVIVIHMASGMLLIFDRSHSSRQEGFCKHFVDHFVAGQGQVHDVEVAEVLKSFPESILLHGRHARLGCMSRRWPKCRKSAPDNQKLKIQKKKPPALCGNRSNY